MAGTLMDGSEMRAMLADKEQFLRHIEVHPNLAEDVIRLSEGGLDADSPADRLAVANLATIVLLELALRKARLISS